MDTWLLHKIRAASLGRVVAWGLSFVGAAIIATSDRRYLSNFLHGPFDLGAAELDSIHDITTTPRYFVRVSGSKIIDTGIRQYTVHTSGGVETSRSEYGAFYALVVGEKFLIAKTGAPSGANVVEGELAPWPAELRDQVLESKEMRAVLQRFYPFYVSDESFRATGYLLIALAVVFTFFFVRNAVPAWQHFRDPATHPLLERVRSWGNSLAVAAEVEPEFRSPRYKGGNGWRVGEKYLIQSKLFVFDVLRLQDLLWAYKKVTRHSINFIPTGKTYEAILACHGGTAAMRGTEKRVHEILAFAQQRVPWVVLGYTPEVETLFKKKRSEFGNLVERRRSEWQHNV